MNGMILANMLLIQCEHILLESACALLALHLKDEIFADTDQQSETSCVHHGGGSQVACLHSVRGA